MLYEIEDLEPDVKKSIDSLLTEERFKTVYKLILDDSFCKKVSIKEFIQEDRFYFANGSLNYGTGELEEYSETNMFIVRSEVDYKKPENCDSVKRYLDTVFTKKQLPYML